MHLLFNLFHIFSPFSLPFHHASSITQFSINLFFSSVSMSCLLSLLQFLTFLASPHPPFLIIFCHPNLPVFHFNVFTLLFLCLAYLFPDSLHLSPKCSNSLFFPIILPPVSCQPTSFAWGSSYLRQKAETRRLSLEVKSNVRPISLLEAMPCAHHTPQNITCTQVTAVQWHRPLLTGRSGAEELSKVWLAVPFVLFHPLLSCPSISLSFSILARSFSRK